MTKRTPAEAFPPGVFLDEELNARGWTQSVFAAITGLSIGTVRATGTGKRRITPTSAAAFAAAFGTSAEFWSRIEQSYTLFREASK